MVNFKKVLVNALINVYIIYAEEEQAKKLEKKRYLFPPNWGATIRSIPNPYDEDIANHLRCW